MKIRVTREHIRRGHRGLCTSCPVAIAIAEALPGSHPWITIRIEIMRHGRKLVLEAPDAVLNFITAFDRDDVVRPFDFDLPLPGEPTPAAKENTAAGAA